MSTPEDVQGLGPDRPPEVVHDWQIGRAVVFVFAVSISVAGVLWGTAYLLLGVPGAAVYPYAFAAITVANGFVFRIVRSPRLSATIEVLAILVVPLLLALHLGGFDASGAIPLWASLAPIGSMLFLGPVPALVALAGFAGVTVVTVLAEGSGWAGSETLPEVAINAFTALNVVVVTTIAVGSTFRFTATLAKVRSEQAKVRELERAYLSQEVLLRQQERLANLGTLSAGVAHELNNPAAALVRTSERLGELLDRGEAEPASGTGAAGTTRTVEERVWVDRSDLDDALALADRAESIERWLAAHGSSFDWDLVEALARSNVSEHVLDDLVAEMGAPAAVNALERSARQRVARGLASELRQGARRISSVVSALKGYSHLDGAAQHDLDVVAGIEDTLVVMRHRLDGIHVERDISDAIPMLFGNLGELNQVWTSLIENAIDALDGAGTLTIRVAPAGKDLHVHVEDDGPGIPPELVDRVFDPFVTTKAPGQGTGLGLHRAYRTVTESYRGTLRVASRPGHTCFTVTLPVTTEALSPV